MCYGGHLLTVTMNVFALLLAVSCSVVLAKNDSETTAKPQQCATQTTGTVTENKHILLDTVLSPEIRNWQIKVTRKPPKECVTVSAMEVIVCDTDGLPKVDLDEYTIIIHRVGSITQVGTLNFTVYCEATKPADDI